MRGTLSRALGSGNRVEFGAEGAVNTLDANLSLTYDAGEGAFPIALPNSNVNIEERRLEVFVNHTWHLDPRWSLDWRVAGEFSRLEFTGDSNQSVDLTFLKPTIQLTRDLGGSSQLRIRVLRDVGQLDFTDFVSSASLADARIDGGNPDLRPQSSWDAEVSADLRPGKDISLTVAAFNRWVTDTADFTPVGQADDLVDAPGNIGDATIYGLRVTARAPVRALRGVTVNVDATLQRSKVDDPLTRRARPISSFQNVNLAAGLRQDLPRIAWGLTYVEKSRTSDYLLREIDRRRESPSLDAFVELPLAGGLRLRLAAVSLLGQDELRDRLHFEPDRRAALAGAELARRNPGTWYQLGISGSF